MNPIKKEKENIDPMRNYQETFTDLQEFENYRCQLHQIQYLIESLKEKHETQKLTIHNHILNRIKQLMELRDCHYQKVQEILALSIIQCLEDVLKIEKQEVKALRINLGVLVEYLAHLDEFLQSSTRQVLLGEGVMIDVGRMNKSISICDIKLKEMLKKHSEFFGKYGKIEQCLIETVENITQSVEVIREINEMVKSKNNAMQTSLLNKCSKENRKLFSQLQDQFTE